LGISLTALSTLGAGVAFTGHRQWLIRHRNLRESTSSVLSDQRASAEPSEMKRRPFGSTGVDVSEAGFGAWAIGGHAYGPVPEDDARDALARAEELGCNFVDTAAVYGRSEEILGRFLAGRRHKWLIATKYSGQPEGMSALLDAQLRRLRTDAVDLYQVHWAPGRRELHLYDQLLRARESGKARFIGVSLSSAIEVDRVLSHAIVDAIQIPFNLLEPNPYLDRLGAIRQSGVAVIARSSLRGGLLSGKYSPGARFSGAEDRRGRMSKSELDDILDRAQRFRFLEDGDTTLAIAAARYPLSFAETSTVILGTKNAAQASINFGRVPETRLTEAKLRRIQIVQASLGLNDEVPYLNRYMRSIVDRILYTPFRVARRAFGP